MKAEVENFVHLASPCLDTKTSRRQIWLLPALPRPPLAEIMPLVSWLDAGNCGQKRRWDARDKPEASIPTYDDPASRALRRQQFDSLGRPHCLTSSMEHPTKRLRLRPLSCPVTSFVSLQG